jgi:DNA polymerase III sliding clamp (beta) subunit (PCNA family)
MEIKVAQLRDALELAKPAVPRKPTLEVLKNVLVRDGKMVATDLESMVIVDMPEADESFLLPYGDVLKMLKYVPGYELLQIKAEKKRLTLSWSEGEASYPAEDVEAFPPVPDFETKDEADIDGDAFIEALTSALPYVATDEKRPVLTGVTVLFGGPIEMGASDGFRMAHIVLPIQFPAEHTTIIPAGAIKTLAHVMAKTPRPAPRGDNLADIVLAKRQVRVALDGKKGLMFTVSSGVSVLVKLIEGTPPDWIKLIPREEPILKVQFLARELETAARRVRDVADQGSGAIRFEFLDGAATISAAADDREVSAKVHVLDVQGAPNRLALNISYLIDYLSEKDGIVTMSWTGGTSPISFQYARSPRILIMPMQVQWAEPLPGAEAVADSSETPSEQTGEEASSEASEEVGADNPKPRKRRGKKRG